MVRLSKKIEYALLALQFMSENPRICSVKEMADQFNVSFELLAKVLSQLSKKGIVLSHQGVNGGFMIARSPSEISINDVMVAINGKRTHIVECQDSEQHACYAEQNCTIRTPLQKLQSVVESAFSSMSVADLLVREHQFVTLELTMEDS
jgi:Rrf2 family protein